MTYLLPATDRHFDSSTRTDYTPEGKADQGENSPGTVMLNEITTITNRPKSPLPEAGKHRQDKG
jgi:hypothetical protein